MFTIHLGIPEVEAFWNDLADRIHSGKASKTESRKYRQLGKAFRMLAEDPRYTGLHSHPVEALTRRYGKKVWESYLENNTPAAGRIFWVYGPEAGGITIIGIEPHPDDNQHSYRKITLSSTGKEL